LTRSGLTYPEVSSKVNHDSFCQLGSSIYTLALPVLLYGSETWTIKASDARKITAAETKYKRSTAGYAWTDYKINAKNCKELKITPIFGQGLIYLS